MTLANHVLNFPDEPGLEELGNLFFNDLLFLRADSPFPLRDQKDLWINR